MIFYGKAYISFSSLADGRVGTFIALDYLSGVSKSDGAIDVVKLMYDMGPDSSVIMQTSVSWKIPYEASQILTKIMAVTIIENAKKI